MLKSIKHFLNIQLLKPSNLKLIFKDILNIKNPIKSNEYHLQKAINWILYAQKITKDGGVSYGYSILDGWAQSYPETSGYIIPTLLNYYEAYGDHTCLKVSREIAEWLLSIQYENGAFQGDTVEKSKSSTIFNTSQIIFGLLKAYEKFNEVKYLNSAIKAGVFLCINQEKTGCWIKYCYQGKPHTYNVRTAWALLELYLLTKEPKFKEAAVLNLNWAKTQITKSYWFKNNDTVSIKNPLLHFLSYTIRGFLESGLILNDESFKEIAFNTSIKLLDFYEKKNKNGFLHARFNSKWESNVNYSCLTGDAQLSIIWLKLYQIHGDKRFLINAIRLNNFLKSGQLITKRFKEIDGGIKGSDPIWGDYRSYYVINWAVKFFCDSLLLEDDILKNNISLRI